MIKVMGLIRRNPKMTQEEFFHYWRTVHVPFVRKTLPGLIRYVGNFPLSEGAAPGSGTAAPTFDGIVELGFESHEALQAAMSGPLFSTKERQDSSAELMDLSLTQSMVVREVLVPYLD